MRNKTTIFLDPHGYASQKLHNRQNPKKSTITNNTKVAKKVGISHLKNRYPPS